MKLQPHETEVIGAWVMKDGHMIADEHECRIAWLIENVFKKIETGEGGWSSLYQDQNDHRLWELTYPRSEMQGGGPRRIAFVSLDEVGRKYGLGRFA
jgi:hypothetical protein